MNPRRPIMIALLVASAASAAVAAVDPSATIEAVYFSPRGGAEAAYVRLIASARETIRAEAYSFTSQAIADALVAADKRGVDVQIIVDPSGVMARRAKAAYCAQGGVAVFVDTKHAIFHNKVLVVDGERVATGSFNFSVQAEYRNAENAVIIVSPALAKLYLDTWQLHRGQSEGLKQFVLEHNAK